MDPASKAAFKPDSDGYYKMCVGGFDVPCYSGSVYLYDNAVKGFFDSSSSFQRRIKSGKLRGELNHPTITPGMSDAQWLQRVATVEPSRYATRFSKMWLEHSKDDKGDDLVLAWARLKPFGTYGDTVKESLHDPEDNTGYSVRSITSIPVLIGGRPTRKVRSMVTYDYVDEQDVYMADKFSSAGGGKDEPGMQSADATLSPMMTEQVIHRGALTDMSANNAVGLMSSDAAVSRVLTDLGWQTIVRREANELRHLKW